MTKSSVNFQPVKSALHAVSHASRELPPAYLLPLDKSLGTICVLDDAGQVSEKLNLKRSLASARALVEKNFSPLWEGVINLPRPKSMRTQRQINEYKNECTEVIKSWIEKYEETTKHKVLRADIHLDEGHIENEQVLLNAHAHVICDRTNEKGRVIKLSPQQLRELQTNTATITNLERGENSRVSKKKHINAHVYKALAAKNGLETQQKVSEVVKNFDIVLGQKNELVKKIKSITTEKDAEIERLKQENRDMREFMKASGVATPADYSALKIKTDLLIATRKKEIENDRKNHPSRTSEPAAVTEMRDVFELDNIHDKQLDESLLREDALDNVRPPEADTSDIDVLKLGTEIEKLKKDITVKDKKLEAWDDRATAFKNAAQKQLDAVVSERNASVKVLGEENLKLATALVIAQRVEPVVDMRSAKERQRDDGVQGEATIAVTSPKRTTALSKPPVTPAPTVFVSEPEPVQVKSMFERLKASMFAFLTELKARALGETVIEAADNARCVGPVVLVDDVRAFQKTGKSTYTAHELAKLDRVPGVDQPKMEIVYKGGRGVVSGRDDIGGSGVGR